MKRTLVILSAVAALGVAAMGLRAWAQAPGGAPRPAAAGPRSKIAVMNINKVIKNYQRANFLGQQLLTESKGYQDRMEMLRNELKAEQDKLAKAQVQQERDAIEKRITNIQRQAQDLNAEAEKFIRGKQGDIMVAIYKEIEGVVSHFAQANDLDMVISYPDAAVPETESNQPPIIIRKLQAPAALPIYYKKDTMDITDVIIKMLNDTYKAPATNAAAPTGTPPAPPR